MTLYATLAEGKAELSADTAADDALMLNYLRIVSRRIDALFQARRPFFAPVREDRAMIVTPDRVNSYMGTFALRDNLLALEGATISATPLTIGARVETWPPLSSPIRYLRLKDRSDTWYGIRETACGTTPAYITVSGVWGYHSVYGQAWLPVTTLSAAVVTTTATSITVTDVDGTDAYGRAPWISAGALLQIDDEWLEVTATNTSTNVCAVRRGVNGSAAATHSNGAVVSVWQPEDTIRRAAARQAAFLYARRGAYQTQAVSEIGIVQYPADLLAELRGILGGYAYE